MKNLDPWDQMLKDSQRECDVLTKELEYWKEQSYILQERNKKLKAQLALWIGTAP